MKIQQEFFLTWALHCCKRLCKVVLLTQVRLDPHSLGPSLKLFYFASASAVLQTERSPLCCWSAWLRCCTWEMKLSGRRWPTSRSLSFWAHSQLSASTLGSLAEVLCRSGMHSNHPISETMNITYDCDSDSNFPKSPCDWSISFRAVKSFLIGSLVPLFQNSAN